MPIITKTRLDGAQFYSHMVYMYSRFGERGWRIPPHGKRSNAQDYSGMLMDRLGKAIGLESSPPRTYSKRGMRKLVARERGVERMREERLRELARREALGLGY